MTKEEWNEWYARFDEIRVEYFFADQESKRGKNKNVRDSAERTKDILRDRTKNYAESNMELYKLIEYPDEMFTYQWFKNDLPRLLERIKEKMQ